jgi:hypothetical protein
VATGFLARAGIALGPLAVSFGYGGGLASAPLRVALVYLSDAALTEIVTALDVTGDEEAAEFALVAVSDQPRTDVRTSHGALTVIETEEET